MILQMDLRGILPLGMPLRFHDPRRSQVRPRKSVTSYKLQATSNKLQVERNGKVLDIIINLIDQG